MQARTAAAHPRHSGLIETLVENSSGRMRLPELATFGVGVDFVDEVGAKLMFDAAHQCGIIAGRAWENPLDHGAHVMTMSTYKSLGGPPGGLFVTRDAEIAERLDAIAFPGMTANFDAAKAAALASRLSISCFRDSYSARFRPRKRRARAVFSSMPRGVR